MSAEPLQWSNRPYARVPKNGCRAEVDGGAYILFKYGASSWQVLFSTGWHIPDEVYLGDSESDALAAAEAHHIAIRQRTIYRRTGRSDDAAADSAEAH